MITKASNEVAVDTPEDVLKEVFNMDGTILKADEKIRFLANDRDSMRLYEMREMALSDYTSGINAAENRKAIEIAKNALRKGSTVDFISDITGLDESTIKQLQAELNNE